MATIGLVLTLAVFAAGHVLRIDKPGEGVKVPHTDFIMPKGDLTVEAWVRPTCELGSGPFQFIVSKNYEGTGFALVMIGKGDYFRFQFEANDVISKEMHRNVLKEGWWHVAGVLESGKSIKLYINGVAVAYKETTAVMKPSGGPLYIGTSPWDTFLGDIDDVIIWNEMRTQEQIVADSKRPPTGKEKNLVAFWDFERRQKGLIWDRAHHAKPGTLLGKPSLPRVNR